ncbi:hypothetical protein EN808_30625 [Mesorhizobium sp. M8A.F.Ca.ET.165.01.1.1]|nr:hypothetical protein EN808_30625 [Mesorhizobium sp. M8A.F.Ca.ET.165.01.1.1]TIS47400.1 MAG: hypothetical protein E5W96_22770 [Mesorhizobium sp.]
MWGKHPDTGEDIYVYRGRFGPNLMCRNMRDAKLRRRAVSVPVRSQ